MAHWSDSYLFPIKEYHYVLRNYLITSLKGQILSEEGKQIIGSFDTYLDFWTHRFGDKFLDMTTMIRLGTAVELGLRDYYRQKMNLPSTSRLEQGIFQRIYPKSRRNNKETAVSIYLTDLNYDLTSNSHYQQVQVSMAHRHLYAHRSGLVDDDYIRQIQDITGEDIRPTLIMQGYPSQDIYWWRPLNQLNDYIESVSAFFLDFP